MKSLFLAAAVLAASSQLGCSRASASPAKPPAAPPQVSSPETHGDAYSQLVAQLDAPGRKVAAYTAQEVKGGGKVTGTVKLEGKAPELPPITRGKDPSVCGDASADDSLVLGPGNTVANAIVTIDVPAGKKIELPKEAVLDQKGCTYLPHVQALPVGTPLTLVNSDPVLHNVHSYKADNTTAFNQAEPLKDQRKTVPLKTAGLLKVKCDVHGWMSAWILVTENPYFAVTGKDGKFSIEGLPAGTYKAHVWHERLAPQELEVTIPASGSATLPIKLAAK